MSVRKVSSPPVKAGLLTTTTQVADPGQAALEGRQTAAIKALEGAASSRSSQALSLVAGANTFNHGLGRKPVGATVTPTVAAADFAWALTSADSKQATITCAGTSQPNAQVEVY